MPTIQPTRGQAHAVLRPAGTPSRTEMCYMVGHIDQWGRSPLPGTSCIRCGTR